jgi:hypothetical protein
VPWTIPKTPGGKPASSTSDATRRIVRGTFSLGLRMKQFPMTTAIGKVHMGTCRQGDGRRDICAKTQESKEGEGKSGH